MPVSRFISRHIITINLLQGSARLSTAFIPASGMKDVEEDEDQTGGEDGER